jgi:hypothetical protein
LLAECGIKPDNSLNRKIGGVEAGEHKQYVYGSSKVVVPAKAEIQFESRFGKTFVIGHWSFLIFYCIELFSRIANRKRTKGQWPIRANSR